jgi:hypothetical protein
MLLCMEHASMLLCMPAHTCEHATGYHRVQETTRASNNTYTYLCTSSNTYSKLQLLLVHGGTQAQAIFVMPVRIAVYMHASRR